ncbi:hypothetical protein [Kitasatospora sp. NPDC059673]|uniref:hypothetical protein n=1 Tax=Kitasatospora sp. NPDC059673 TaxID=3346901 RepID=UPI0036B1D66A
MSLIEFYPAGFLGLDWKAASEDVEGVLLAETGDGVAIARATDPRKVLVLDPDEWDDLLRAAKSGWFDGFLGGGVLCKSPRSHRTGCPPEGEGRAALRPKPEL